MLRAAGREGEENKKNAAERREEDKEEDVLGRLNVVWGYTVIKTSRLGSFSAPVRAADTNSRRIKYKPHRPFFCSPSSLSLCGSSFFTSLFSHSLESHGIFQMSPSKYKLLSCFSSPLSNSCSRVLFLILCLNAATLTPLKFKRELCKVMPMSNSQPPPPSLAISCRVCVITSAS